MSYIASNNISVFPLSKNRPSDRSSRLFYENNVANLIRQVVDVEGFIISPADEFKLTPDVSDTVVNGQREVNVNLTKQLIFNLYGYYFSINPTTLFQFKIPDEVLTADKQFEEYTLYATIQIDPVSLEVVGMDQSSQYQGLEIVSDIDNKPSNQGWHSIKLCTFNLNYTAKPTDDNPNWTLTVTVNNAAYEKISAKSLDMSISRIEGKH